MKSEQPITNEEIIRQGGDNVVEKLWENNIGFIYETTKDWHHFILESNLSEETKRKKIKEFSMNYYLAVYDAYRTYNSKEGAFTTHLRGWLTNHFHKDAPVFREIKTTKEKIFECIKRYKNSGNTPTDEAIASELDISIEIVRKHMQSMKEEGLLSLDGKTTNQKDKKSNGIKSIVSLNAKTSNDDDCEVGDTVPDDNDQIAEWVESEHSKALRDIY